MKKKFEKAIQELESVKNSIDLRSEELLNHADAILRNYGDDKMLAHFEQMTEFDGEINPNDRGEIKRAIDVMISDFRMKIENIQYDHKQENRFIKWFINNPVGSIGSISIIIGAFWGSHYTLYKLGFDQGAIRFDQEKLDLHEKNRQLIHRIDSITKQHEGDEVSWIDERQNWINAYTNVREKYDSVMKLQGKPLYVNPFVKQNP